VHGGGGVRGQQEKSKKEVSISESVGGGIGRPMMRTNVEPPFDYAAIASMGQSGCAVGSNVISRRSERQDMRHRFPTG